MSNEKIETDFSKTNVVGETKWLRLETLEWTNREGRALKWDRCVRTTKSAENSIDAVSILVILEHGEKDDEIVLVKQFRPPLNKFSIELPAGLVDPGESLEQAALRELKEECGYEGIVSSVSPGLAMSPGLTNESISLVSVHVDMRLAVNQHPVQSLDENEDIELLHVPVKGLLEQLNRWTADENFAIFSGLYYLAVGLMQK